MDTQNIAKSPFFALEQWESDSIPTTFQTGGKESFWGQDGLTFDDVLDVVNPLQHIPVASTKYQQASGDTASEGAKLVGGVLFGVLTGGILGVAAALVNAAVRHDTGKDLPQHALALLEGDTPTEAAGQPVAEAGVPTALADASTQDEKPIPSAEPPGYPPPTPPVNPFVDDVPVHSLHPAERLLAINRYPPVNPSANSIGPPRQEPESTPQTSIRNKLSEAYGSPDAVAPGGFWWEV